MIYIKERAVLKINIRSGITEQWFPKLNVYAVCQKSVFISTNEPKHSKIYYGKTGNKQNELHHEI